MNFVNEETHTNAYMKAADVRCLLHDMIIGNKYGFTSILIRCIRTNTGFKLINDEAYPSEITIGGEYGSEIYCSYELSEHGFNKSSKLSTIDTAMYVDLLTTFSNYIIDIVHYLYNYNTKNNIACPDLDTVYDFIVSDRLKTKSSISMLFDIRIYMDHFVLTI